MPLFPRVNSPADLKQLKPEELSELAGEVRQFLIDTVHETGGHLGASLGVVELTIALHYLLDSPKDKLVWDVSHQAYAHKVLTGRKDRMKSLRQRGGLSGFTDPEESAHDFFKVGHASTSISQAIGLAIARDLAKKDEKIVAIIGDGALTGGLAYEALNNAGHTKRDLLIIVNDNKMSIAPNVGAISNYFNSILTNPLYNRIRAQVEQATSRMPRLQRLIKNADESFKNLIVPGIWFEELGFRYFGPVDGHDLKMLIPSLKKILAIKGPKILHLLTKKGMGYDLAEADPEKFHGISAKIPESVKVEARTESVSSVKSYTEVFSDLIVKFAERDGKVAAITAAMPSGTGLVEFQRRFPERFFDVGIAEEHAVTFAGALAKGGFKPVCAIYSTFLQRGIDQMFHDIALQGEGVVFAIDRAGVVGEDGPTHHGLFDMSLMRSIPGAVLGSPKDAVEMKRMFELGFRTKGVFGIRYPRGRVPQEFQGSPADFGIGEGEILKKGADLCILTLGSLVKTALETASLLERQGIAAGVINMRFAKPLDIKLLEQAAKGVPLIVTMEDHALLNGFGTACLEALSDLGLSHARLVRLGFPDVFVPHAKREELLETADLTSTRAVGRILKEVKACKK